MRRILGIIIDIVPVINIFVCQCQLSANDLTAACNSFLIDNDIGLVVSSCLLVDYIEMIRFSHWLACCIIYLAVLYSERYGSAVRCSVALGDHKLLKGIFAVRQISECECRCGGCPLYNTIINRETVSILREVITAKLNSSVAVVLSRKFQRNT